MKRFNEPGRRETGRNGLTASKRPKRDGGGVRALRRNLLPFAVKNFLARPSHRGIRKALIVLEKNFKRPLKVDYLAAVAGLSTRGVHKAFVRHTGYSPGEVLRLVRLEFAKNLLRSSDCTLKEAALWAGYRKANTFYVAFRQGTGLSPDKFRRQFRQRLELPATIRSHRRGEKRSPKGDVSPVKLTLALTGIPKGFRPSAQGWP